MAKRKTRTTSAPKRKQRPRAEIDRNYFFADVLRRTGSAVFIVLILLIADAPFSVSEASRHSVNFGAVMGIFAATGLSLYLYGRHLRREATHWEAD